MLEADSLAKAGGLLDVEGYVLDIYRRADGSMWFATDNGVAVKQGEGVRWLRQKEESSESDDLGKKAWGRIIRKAMWGMLFAVCSAGTL